VRILYSKVSRLISILIMFKECLMQLDNNSIHLARLHAHICGDGHIYIEEGDRGKRYIIEYTNKSIELINSFINDVIAVVGVHPVIISPAKKNALIARVESKYLFHTLKRLEAGNSREWRASVFLESSCRVIANWLSAFIDDEGYIDRVKHRIVLNSVNYNGLIDVQSILITLGIDSKMYYYSEKWNFYRLIIGGINNLCS